MHYQYETCITLVTVDDRRSSNNPSTCDQKLPQKETITVVAEVPLLLLAVVTNMFVNLR